MRNAQDLQSMMPALEAIPFEEVMAPTMPMATYIQEAEDLNLWLQPDRALLAAHGQPGALLDSLPARIGAAREAESEWNAARYDKEAAQAAYEVEAERASDLLVRTTRHFRYAFRRHPGLLARLPSAGSWMSDADRIQYLNDAAVMGREHLDLLAASGFDPMELNGLSAASDTLAERYAAARSEKASGRGSKALRDRAYTHLKAAVDEIRAAGRFLFWEDEARLQGYRSEYVRRNRSRGGEDAFGAGADAALAAPAGPRPSPSAPSGAQDAAL